MENLNIEPTNRTPKVYFDARTGVLEIAGRSIPENSADFYQPILDWLDEAAQSEILTFNMVLKLEYFNTSSSKFILDILKKLEKIHKDTGKAVFVKWYYDEKDEDMEEAGHDFRDIINLDFELIPTQLSTR
ncbi:MAG: hypothetical protein KatS3mg033_0542 [Thermonema sp.]|jgi:hypothetical protein|uniref:DUF1987 domain-containing protein n=1 Tax=Thermonema TaxID=28194 RepID=UPI00056FAEC4|nr:MULTISPECIES: DUF1987 domain-containing protein [Thermonema]GIV38742.1 MAG: hypothetical protein KatS3mg033_0542 [Thermonema sp.]